MVNPQPKWNTVLRALENNAAPGNYDNDVYALMFISFDVVNSSAYKTINPCKWEAVLTDIMGHAIGAFETSPSGSYQFWKLLGDEVIYTRRIYDFSEIAYILDDAYAKMQFLNKLIDCNVVCDQQASELLGVKSTVWLADISTSCELSHNVYSEYEIKDNRRQSDYTGSDIDTGFRISAYSMKNRLMISCNLAYIMCREPTLLPCGEKLKIICYQSLKGVWNGEPYPIITYHGDVTTTFEASIAVAFTTQKERLLQAYLENQNNRHDTWNGGYKTYEASVIVPLCQQRGVTEQYEQLMSLIAHQPRRHMRKTRPLKRAHCTVVGYGIDEQGLYFLLGKQPKERLWRFVGFDLFLRAGNGHIFEVEDFFADTMGISLRIEKDLRRYSDMPLAVDFYQCTDKQHNQVAGEVLLGRIKGAIPKDSEQHQFKVVRADEIAQLQDCGDGVVTQLLASEKALHEHGLV